MGRFRSDQESASGSDSGSSRGSISRTPSPQTAPTPGYSLEHHDSRSPISNRSRSNTPGSEQIGSQRSRSHSRSHSPNKSRSRSGTPKSHHSGAVSSPNSPYSRHSKSPRSHHSGSPVSQKSKHSMKSGRSRSRSHTPHSPLSNHSRSSHSHRSGSRQSHHSKSKTPEKNQIQTDIDSRSNSPNLQIDDQAGSDRSRSHSRSASRSKSGSKSRSHSRSRSKSHSRSRSKSGSQASRSRSRSVSRRGKSRSRSQSRSQSRDSSRSGSGRADNTEKRKRKVVSSGSEAENDEKEKKKTKMSGIIDSESEEEGSAKDVTADALFGDADDISTDDEEKKSEEKPNDQKSVRSRSSSRHSEAGSSDDEKRRSRSREDDRENEDKEEEEAEPIPETRIDVEIPRIVTDLGKDIHFVKLPNFLSVETRPFDQETYEDEIDEEETMDEEGRQRIKLKVSNTIRWREYMDKTGKMIKESNARVVKWSDGSMSLHLGNEIFDVYKQPLQGDHNHLFIRQGTGLQGQAVFRTKLTFRPHSTESFTHKKMTMSLADRSQKTSGIKILTQVGKDPTADRQYNLKKEEEKLRQAMRKQHQSRPKRSGRASGGNAESHAGANSSYRDDGSDDENAISLNAIKNKYKKNELKQGAAAIYSSDEDEGSDFEARRRKKLDKVKTSKALRDSDEESEGNRSRDDEEDHDGNDEDRENQGSDSNAVDSEE